jgi:tetratricopeptide (TPR) repeat protein
MDRLAMLQKMVATQPGEPFGHYGLAMELRKLGRSEEATAAFETLMSEHPSYVAAYLMAGNHHAELGDKAQARAVYQRGIEVARAASDGHTEGELESALMELGA